MSQIDEAIKDHAASCADTLPSRFVPWSWVVGACVGIVAAIVSVAVGSTMYVGDVKIDVQKAIQHNAEQDRRIDKIESIQDDVRWIREKLARE